MVDSRKAQERIRGKYQVILWLSKRGGGKKNKVSRAWIVLAKLIKERKGTGREALKARESWKKQKEKKKKKQLLLQRPAEEGKGENSGGRIALRRRE